jgi:hypothetical protein
MVVVWLEKDAVKTVDHALNALVSVLDSVPPLTEVVNARVDSHGAGDGVEAG